MAVASLFEDLLDQYKIEQHVARKRYTDLFQAYDVDDDRQVRIDALRPEFAGESSFAGRFVSRARALAQVRHPNIAPILHIGKASGGTPYVAQAAVDGYSLTHRLEQLDPTARSHTCEGTCAPETRATRGAARRARTR